MRKGLLLLSAGLLAATSCASDEDTTAPSAVAVADATVPASATAAVPASTTPPLAWLSNEDLFVQAWPELTDSIRQRTPWTGELFGRLILPARGVHWQLCSGGTEEGDCDEPLIITDDPAVVAANPALFERMTDNPASTPPVNIMSTEMIGVTGTFDPATGMFTEAADDDALVTVVTALPTDAIADGIVSGVLVETDGCVFIDHDEFGRRLLVLPSGTAWDQETSSVVNPDGTSVAVGDQVWAQGGESTSIDDLATYWLDEDQLVEAQNCGQAAGVTTAVISGTLVRGLSP
jgi:hypothetical protein